jgi:hypothetical protein
VESNNNLPEIKACGGGICGRTVIAIPCKTRARGQGLGSKCDVIEGAVPAKPARGGHRQASVVRRHLGPIPSIPPPPRAQGRQVGDASCVRRSRHGNPPRRPLANCDCAPRLHFTLTLDCPSRLAMPIRHRAMRRGPAIPPPDNKHQRTHHTWRRAHAVSGSAAESVSDPKRRARFRNVTPAAAVLFGEANRIDGTGSY